jgi:hypothetical protein
MGIFDKFRKMKEEKKDEKAQISNQSSGVKREVSFDISDLGLLSGLAPSEELKERFSNAGKMLKQKILENWKVDVDSQDYEKLIKLRTLVSPDPETSERIFQAKETYKHVLGTVAVLDFDKEELKGLVDCIRGMGGSGVEELKSKLSDAYSK